MMINWNGSQDTLECLFSIEKINYPRSRIAIWVADNGSTDNSINELMPQIVQMKSSGWHSVNLLKLNRNHGSPGGFNRIYQEIDKSTDIIIRLDNDVILHPYSIFKVAQRFSQVSDLAILGVQSFLQNKRDVKCSGAWYINWRFNTQYVLYPSDLVECDSIVGNYMAMRYDFIKKLDYLFDERLFITLDEYELCIRVKKFLAKKIFFDPDIICYHKGSSSTSKIKDIVLYCNCRNSIFIFKKYAPKNGDFLLGIFVILLRLIKAFIFRDRFKLIGYLDGLRSHFLPEDRLRILFRS